MKINATLIKQFNPCTGGFRNYKKVFGEVTIDFTTFLRSDDIPLDDKHWLINREWKDRTFQKIQRQYALTCASRAVDEVNSPELNEFFMLVCLVVEMDDYSLKDSAAYRAASSAAYSAADRAAASAAYSAAARAAASAAYSAAASAADRAAERKVQLEIFIEHLLESEVI